MTSRPYSRRTVLAGATASVIWPGAAVPQDDDRVPEGGIGGTGIVGLLTEFGSLIVGGAYIRTDTQTVFSDGFGQILERDLRIGQGLTVEATRIDGQLVARRVHVTDPLVGRITFVDDGRRVMRVNGVEVDVEDPVSGFDVGDRVTVSGLWRSGRVSGSLITPARSGLDLVSGDVGRISGGRQIGATRVQGRGINVLPLGSFATATGRYDVDAQRFYLAQLTPNRFVGAAGALKQLRIEGYLEPAPQAPGFRVSGLGHSFRRDLDLSKVGPQRALFDGPYTGRFDARNATLLPEDMESRAALLRRLSR